MTHFVHKWWNYPLQALCYVAFIAVVGYFATSPPYVHLPEGQALEDRQPQPPSLNSAVDTCPNCSSKRPQCARSGFRI